ncbi:hypothetical protein ABTL56_20095, partial [Acinetobacter baumannii]
RLDAGQAHLAAVVETDAARVDDGGDAALALGFELAWRSEGRVTRGEQNCDGEMKSLRHGARRGCVMRQS